MADNKAGSFLIGLVIGGALGAVLAFVLAPRPGDEVRQDLYERGLELRKRAGETVDQVVGVGRTTVDEQRQRVQQAMEESREASARTREQLMSRFERAKGQQPS
ncbi:MAG: YtxH domain-containing protein [Actinobacteria bacterium]|nr:YtxH domain-containing protein [Actinomycetota bacterium]MDA8218299.1 YtxH domain-containing protein [Dehalococcoidales bacterium]